MNNMSKLAKPENLTKIGKILNASFKKYENNRHIRVIWMIYNEIGNKLSKLIKTYMSQENIDNNDNEYKLQIEIEEEIMIDYNNDEESIHHSIGNENI